MVIKLLCVLFLVASFHAYCQHDDDIDARTEQYIIELSARKFQWLIQKQYDSLDALLHKEIKYIHSNGWIETKDEVLQDLKSGKLIYQKVNVAEAGAASSGKTVVVTGKGSFEVLMEGKPIEIRLLYTEVYVKTKKRRKLFSRHACKIN
jgi:hypothetical protein